MLGSEPHFLDQALSQLLTLPVRARRDAKRQTGTFPMVLAHPGLGGAFADNFVLYEPLASHGYAVISSAFQSGLADALMALRKDAAALAAYQAGLAALERVPISPPALHQVYVSRLRKRIALANELVAKGR